MRPCRSDLLTNCQTDAIPRYSGPCTLPNTKDLVVVLGVDADAVVGDRKPVSSVRLLHGDVNDGRRAAPLFDRIPDEVLKQLHKFVEIHRNRWQWVMLDHCIVFAN